MKCPVCGVAELIHDTRDLPYTYKGETTVIPAVTADFCPACDESITDMAETERVMREMQAFNTQVNAAIVDPGFIVSVRKKLHLGQREAAEIFGGGPHLQPDAAALQQHRQQAQHHQHRQAAFGFRPAQPECWNVVRPGRPIRRAHFAFREARVPQRDHLACDGNLS
mgnify:CR=1 FL=1